MPSQRRDQRVPRHTIQAIHSTLVVIFLEPSAWKPSQQSPSKSRAEYTRERGSLERSCGRRSSELRHGETSTRRRNTYSAGGVHLEETAVSGKLQARLKNCFHKACRGMQEHWERQVRFYTRDWHVPTDGNPGSTQQRVVTEYGYEADAASARDDRGGEGGQERVRWWSEFGLGRRRCCTVL
jgi:hypothetical protein